MAGTVEQEAAIWKKLHDNREEHIEQARRARDMQVMLAAHGLTPKKYEDFVYTGEMAMRVDELEMSVRSANCLRNANIRVVGQIYDMGKKQLLRLPNFGKKSLAEVNDVLSSKNLPTIE